MDEDEYVFELFIEMMERIEDDTEDGRLRVLSKEPHYATDDPVRIQPNIKHIEKR